MIYDIIIIGAGVSGTACARELSKYKAKICVLDREVDVCCGTSKANSGIVHAGYDAPVGSLKARLNLRGNLMMDRFSRELDFPFQRNGSLVLCLEERDFPGLKKLYNRGIANHVEGLRLLDREAVLKMEPGITKNVYAALYAPSAGLVCPFGLNIALAENAAVNGVEFYFNTEIKNITKEGNYWKLYSGREIFFSKCVINAAGVYADSLHNMVSEKKLHITARKGEYCLLDKNAGNYVSHTIFSLPGEYGKGVLVTPTVHGNLLFGPNAADVADKDGTNTTEAGLREVLEKACSSVEDLPRRQIITSFAGLRAHEEGDDFVIGEAYGTDGFFDCAGIESPGLTSAPAIGEMVAELVTEKYSFAKKTVFINTREGIRNFQKLSKEEKNEFIRRNPAYGNIVCRCEGITEGEILDAIRRPLGATTLDGIKRRTRAGMGRCQSGFCSPKVMAILASELGVSPEKITKSGGRSYIVAGPAENPEIKEADRK